jgi:hypothetical protein
MHSALTGVKVYVTHWLAHFFWGGGRVTHCADRERERDRNIIFRWSFIGSLFLGFHNVTTGNVFLIWYKKERTSKHSAIWFILGAATPPRTNQIASCFDALSITNTIWEIQLFDGLALCSYLALPNALLQGYFINDYGQATNTRFSRD